MQPKIGKQGGLILQGQAFFLLQRIRDEAHRFAITNNRKSRLKAATKSKLDDIPGVGPKTKLKLLQVFGSVKHLAKALQDNPEIIDELIGFKLRQKISAKLLNN